MKIFFDLISHINYLYKQFNLKKDMNDCEPSDLESILLKYPGLVMTKRKSKIFLQGPIKIKNIWYNIKLTCSSFPSIENFHLHIQQGINIKIYAAAKLNIPTNWSIHELIENLDKIIEPLETPTQVLSDINKEALANIYAEISRLYAPSEYEILLNDNCSRVRFTKFLHNDHHFFEVVLPTLELCEHSLPSCIDLQSCLDKAESLSMLLHQYKALLDCLKPFYDNFTDIDELCHVVQPPLPNFKENWRLFVLKERVFLKVQFNDPFSPFSSMSILIIGPTSEVTRLRRVYSEGMRDWDSELDVHKNLLRIFDLCFFPMAPTDGSQKVLQHCNICYCYKDEHSETPVISCDNSHCSLIFHAACLKEWFNTLTDGKTFLDVVFGSCPFCKSKLSTSFQEILNKDNMNKK